MNRTYWFAFPLALIACIVTIVIVQSLVSHRAIHVTHSAISAAPHSDPEASTAFATGTTPLGISVAPPDASPAGATPTIDTTLPAIDAMSNGDEHPTSDQRLWAMGMAALVVEGTGGTPDLLGGSVKTDELSRQIRDLLQRSWGITSRDDLLQTLQWLETEGHRKQFEAMAAATPAQLDAYAQTDGAQSMNQVDVVRQNREALGANGIVAWDFGRYAALCGWGYVAGYITEDEAWQKIMPMARRTQPLFHSWKEFGNNYLIGRRFWSLEETQESGQVFDEALQYLLNNGRSPWVRVPWNLDLSRKAGQN